MLYPTTHLLRSLVAQFVDRIRERNQTIGPSTWTWQPVADS